MFANDFQKFVCNASCMESDTMWPIEIGLWLTLIELNVDCVPVKVGVLDNYQINGCR